MSTALVSCDFIHLETLRKVMVAKQDLRHLKGHESYVGYITFYLVVLVNRMS